MRSCGLPEPDGVCLAGPTYLPLRLEGPLDSCAPYTRLPSPTPGPHTRYHPPLRSHTLTTVPGRAPR